MRLTEQNYKLRNAMKLEINPVTRTPYRKPPIVKYTAIFQPNSFQAIEEAIIQGN